MNMPKKRVSQKQSISSAHAKPQAGLSGPGVFMRKALAWGAGILGILITVSFFTGTYDTAQAKDTLLFGGGSALVLWWISLLVQEKRFFVSRANWLWYIPFWGYYAFMLASVLWAPYRTECWAEFSRYALYFGLTLLALAQFRLFSVRVLSRCIVWAAWISYVYGFLQVIDLFAPGADFMPWRAFFGDRIFSTQANPNFFGDFIVFSSFIILAEFLRTRQKRLLVLYVLGLVDLFFTQSKGSWLAFGAVFAVGALGYVNYFSSRLAAYRRKVNIAAACVAAGAVLLAGVYALKRVDSVGFRVHTWASAFSMVQDSPVLGTGVGSFKTIYPAYRKPQIFFIENAHNTETQHAENESLELWATAGSVGLILFLWMLFFVFFAAHKRLLFLRGKNQPESYWLWGYGCALAGILIHNQVDVSLHFASTGVFFALFLGVLAGLSGPGDCGELNAPCAGDGPAPASAGKAGPLAWCLRALVWVALAWAFFALAGQFAGVTEVMSSARFGDAFLKAAAWAVFLAAVLGVFFVTARAAGRFSSPCALAVLLLVPGASCLAFRPFMADHYYGIATGFAARSQRDGALDYFQKAIDANPFNMAYRQYRGTLLAGGLDFAKTFNTKKGDESSPATDYERVLRDFDAVRAASPNHALLHQAYGEFYYSAALKYSDMASRAADRTQYDKYKKLALENMDKAQASFEYSLLLDPVNQATYVFLTQIAILQRRPQEARAWISAYRQGPSEVKEEAFLQKMRTNPRMDALEKQVDAAFGKK